MQHRQQLQQQHKENIEAIAAIVQQQQQLKQDKEHIEALAAAFARRWGHSYTSDVASDMEKQQPQPQHKEPVEALRDIIARRYTSDDEAGDMQTQDVQQQQQHQEHKRYKEALGAIMIRRLGFSSDDEPVDMQQQQLQDKEHLEALAAAFARRWGYSYDMQQQYQQQQQQQQLQHIEALAATVTHQQEQSYTSDDETIDTADARETKRQRRAECKALAEEIEALGHQALQSLLGPLYSPTFLSFHISLTKPQGYIWYAPPHCTYLRLLNWDPNRKLESIMKPYLLEIKEGLQSGMLRPVTLEEAERMEGERAEMEVQRELEGVRKEWEDIMLENEKEEEEEGDVDGGVEEGEMEGRGDEMDVEI